MRTFPIKNETDTTYAFEIENAYISVTDVVSTLARVDGVSEISRRNHSGSADYLVSFQFRGKGCVVWEPFGVKSRYWFGPQEAERDMEFADVERAFKQYRPAFLRRLLGDLRSLRFLSRR